jgi:Ni/Co efflux regulator RcnB
MKRAFGLTGCMLAALVAATMVASPAMADNQDGKGKGKGKGNENRERAEHRPDKGSHFVDQQRVSVREYYGEQYARGSCPPGLAKKNNGCMPPGQAKKWQIGRPLPRDVVFYDLPPALVVQIGAPPAGQRYVRVAADILLIAVGTGMVIDAIQDLGRM